MNTRTAPELTESLKTLRDDVMHVVDTLNMHDAAGISSWLHAVNGKLLPRLSPDFPLMASVCGGGSSGKSTLFNSLIGEKISPSGGKAGINRRVLVSAPGEIFRNKAFLSTLFEPLGAASEPMTDSRALTEPGCPLYVLNSNVPRNMVLMDTPDFDTGAGGVYANREVVRQALEASDILVYIFTNSNYNNRDNTDFISQMLTGIGMRKCFLVYRAYSVFEDREVVEHAMTVARNIYGRDAEKYILGIYRTDEDNTVAAGQKFMALRPARPADPPFRDALTQLDPKALRPELLSTILRDTLAKARDVHEKSAGSLDGLRLYLDALQTAQSHCLRDALRHFPMDLILKRFIEIWLASDPSHVRAMRKTGSVVGFPVKMLSGAASWISNAFSGGDKGGTGDFRDKVEEDLLNAVNRMRAKAVSDRITAASSIDDPVGARMYESAERLKKTADYNARPRVEPDAEKGAYTFRIAAHPVVFPEQEALKLRDWRAVRKTILSQKDVIIKISEDIDRDLRELADEFRERMGFSAKMRQSFSAFLNVIPATVAVTYIFATGDPAGGAGLKVKLAGLFGLNDLYALIAVPATTGLSKADRGRVEEMLVPIAQSWLNNKLRTLRELFEREITGGLIRAAEDAIQKTENRISKIERTVEMCGDLTLP